MFDNILKAKLKICEYIVYDDPFFNNSNKEFDFVGWVIKTPWLIYFRSVKFDYVKETHWC